MNQQELIDKHKSFLNKVKEKKDEIEKIGEEKKVFYKNILDDEIIIKIFSIVKEINKEYKFKKSYKFIENYRKPLIKILKDIIGLKRDDENPIVYRKEDYYRNCILTSDNVYLERGDRKYIIGTGQFIELFADKEFKNLLINKRTDSSDMALKKLMTIFNFYSEYEKNKSQYGNIFNIKLNSPIKSVYIEHRYHGFVEEEIKDFMMSINSIGDFIISVNNDSLALDSDDEPILDDDEYHKILLIYLARKDILKNINTFKEDTNTLLSSYKKAFAEFEELLMPYMAMQGL